MATVIPNPLSGVGDAALGYLDTVMSKRRMRLEEEDLALRRQMQGRQLGIQEDQQALSAQIANLNAFNTLSELLPHDTPIDNIPGMSDLLHSGLGPMGENIDPTTLGVLNRSTVEELLSENIRRIIGLTEEEGGFTAKELTAMGLEKLTGSVLSPSRRIELAEADAGLGIATANFGKEQVEALTEMFSNLKESPEGLKTLENINRVQLGLDPVIQADILRVDPNTGALTWGKQDFDSQLSANMFATMTGLQVEYLLGQITGSSSGVRLQVEERNRQIEALTKIAETLGLAVGPGVIEDIIDTYTFMLKGGTVPQQEWSETENDWVNVKDAEGNDIPYNPFQDLIDKHYATGDHDTVSIATAMVKSIRTGAMNINQVLSQSELGQQIGVALAMGKELNEQFGSEVAFDQLLEFTNTGVMKELMRGAGGETGWNIGVKGQGWWPGPELLHIPNITIPGLTNPQELGEVRGQLQEGLGLGTAVTSPDLETALTGTQGAANLMGIYQEALKALHNNQQTSWTIQELMLLADDLFKSGMLPSTYNNGLEYFNSMKEQFDKSQGYR